MRSISALLGVLALSSLAAAQLPTFVVFGSGNASGSLCDPWSCVPAPVSAVRGDVLALHTRGPSGVYGPGAHLLLVSTLPAICVGIPGIGGNLIASPPLFASEVPLHWARFNEYRPPGGPTCGGWVGIAWFSVPLAAPPGTQVVMQYLAATPYGPQPFGFTNAVVLTIQ